MDGIQLILITHQSQLFFQVNHVIQNELFVIYVEAVEDASYQQVLPLLWFKSLDSWNDTAVYLLSLFETARAP